MGCRKVSLDSVDNENLQSDNSSGDSNSDTMSIIEADTYDFISDNSTSMIKESDMDSDSDTEQETIDDIITDSDSRLRVLQTCDFVVIFDDTPIVVCVERYIKNNDFATWCQEEQGTWTEDNQCSHIDVTGSCTYSGGVDNILIEYYYDSESIKDLLEQDCLGIWEDL